MKKKKLTCFKAYDIRGEIGVSINETIVYRISRATSQYFAAKTVVIGFDARESSKSFALSAAKGASDAGARVLNIGLAGTEEMYWAVSEFQADAGIEITASHNPINYNGLKIVKERSRPLDQENDFLKIKKMAERGLWFNDKKLGEIIDISEEARRKYITKLSTFIEANLNKSLKILVNCGNGAAGPTFNALTEKLNEIGFQHQFIKLFEKPDQKFPNGIPNPILPKNQVLTSKAVINSAADFGVAFDGDFDRCFFFDENGRFIPGEYIVGVIAKKFLIEEKGARIVLDPRVIYNSHNIIKENYGVPVISRAGHTFFKSKMSEVDAIYGGEMSSHHYFRDFAYCDSGMIPLLIIIEFLSSQDQSLGEIVQEMFNEFPSSGEKNFSVKKPEDVISVLLNYFRDKAKIEDFDGLSFDFTDWRFNIRKSNTEPLLRLNVEAKYDKNLVDRNVKLISDLILNAEC